MPRFFSLVVFLAWTILCGSLRAQEARSLQDRASALQAVFEERADAKRRMRLFEGISGVLGGGSMLGLGTRRLLDKDRDSFTRGMGIFFLSGAGASLIGGSAALFGRTDVEKRLERWREASGQEISEAELYRFEGELRASAQGAKHLRQIARFTGLGTLLSGAALLTITPLADLSKKARRSAYIAGSFFAATGGIGFGLSFPQSGDEEAWDRYSKGHIASGEYTPSQALSLRPALTHQGVGLSVAGHF